MEKRSVGCTQLNEQSSRSHAVFTLRIEGVNDSSKLKVWAPLGVPGKMIRLGCMLLQFLTIPAKLAAECYPGRLQACSLKCALVGCVA
jgi:hypothetical protein